MCSTKIRTKHLTSKIKDIKQPTGHTTHNTERCFTSFKKNTLYLVSTGTRPSDIMLHTERFSQLQSVTRKHRGTFHDITALVWKTNKNIYKSYKKIGLFFWGGGRWGMVLTIHSHLVR